jgi:hypothetical protein
MIKVIWITWSLIWLFQSNYQSFYKINAMWFWCDKCNYFILTINYLNLVLKMYWIYDKCNVVRKTRNVWNELLFYKMKKGWERGGGEGGIYVGVWWVHSLAWTCLRSIYFFIYLFILGCLSQLTCTSTSSHES